MKLQGICGLSDGEAGIYSFVLDFEILRALFLHTEARELLKSAKIAFMRPIS